MQRLHVVVAAMVLVVALASATPVAAQEQVDALPELATLTSVRQRQIDFINETAVRVCQWEYASFSRGHGTCHALITIAIPEIGVEQTAGDVLEAVIYDGTIHLRLNNETTWQTIPDDLYDPNGSLVQVLYLGFAERFIGNDYTLTLLGTETVNGTPATQYQFWSHDTQRNGENNQSVYDMFISDQGLVLKDVASTYGTFSFGEGMLRGIWTYYDHNVPITVTPPPADQVASAERAQ